MKRFNSTFLIFPCLLIFMVGCGSEKYSEKKNQERIGNQQLKVQQLRQEHAAILLQIDSLLNETSALTERAKQLSLKGDNEEAGLVLDTAEAVLVEANTRRLAAERALSYQIALKAYNERAAKIQALRRALELNLPSTAEGQR